MKETLLDVLMYLFENYHDGEFSDSDNQGAALAYTLPEGPSRPLSLPLDPKASDDIEGILGWRGRDELIHRDDLVLLQPAST